SSTRAAGGGRRGRRGRLRRLGRRWLGRDVPDDQARVAADAAFVNQCGLLDRAHRGDQLLDHRDEVLVGHFGEDLRVALLEEEIDAGADLEGGDPLHSPTPDTSIPIPSGPWYSTDRAHRGWRR